MTSIIYLYKNSEIIPSKNFVVEGIENYLSGLTKITISDFQYLRNDLKLTIKINRSQEFSEAILDNNYNYLKVVQNGVNYYYFVLRKTQVSQSTIAIELEMDTINTFKWGVSFQVSPRTRVKREHKDRIIARLTGLNYVGYFDRLITLVNNDSFSGIIVIHNKITNEYRELEGTLYYRFIVPNRHYYNLEFSNIEDQKELYPLRESEDWEVILFKNDDNPDGIIGQSEDADTTFHNAVNNTIEKRNIDYYSEGITPLLYKKELGNLESSENLTWNLIYRNATNDENTAIQCFAIPSEGEIKIVRPASKTLTYTDFEDGINYLFAPWTGNYSLIDNNGKKYNVKAQSLKWICKNIRRSGATLQIRAVHYEGYTNGTQFVYSNRIVYSWYTITSITFEQEEIAYYKNASIPPQPGILPESLPSSNGIFSSTTSVSNSITTLDQVDRVEPKLIKIISIPYFPSEFTYDSENFEMTTDETWTYESTIYPEGSLSLNDLNARFSRVVESEIANPLNVFDITLNIDTNATRNDYYESKLFHSDYYQPKFVYDSFGFIFELEKIDEELFSPSEKFTFEFIMTSTINSKFMFKFPEYVLKFSTQDYDNILPVSRNNEAPIYNSAYITYLRTAYRYDLKYLAQNSALTNFSAVGGTINSMTSAYNIGTGKNASIGGALLSGLSGIANVLAESISTLNSNEWQLESKIAQLRNQANSVSGSDDLDLLENYSGNRAKLTLYEVSPRMKQLLADLFYYFGYTTDEMKIPEINTRYWFNFLACDLVINGVDYNISDVCKENLIARYSAGITFLHMNNGTWNFDQDKENWETKLI